MLAWIVLPFILVPTPTRPPACQLEVLPTFIHEERMLEGFEERVGHYVRLHRRLERALPPEQLFEDLEDMSAAVETLHYAIADARPYAQEGNVFTPAAAYVLTRRLHRAITDNGYTPAEVLAAINAGYRPGIGVPEINGRFPPSRDRDVWPALRAVLPALPDELRYRFVDRDLVLLDVHADLVVDILRDALPAAR